MRGGFPLASSHRIHPSLWLNPLNDFAFKKILGEKGDEPQLIAFLNAVLHRTGRDTIKDVRIMENLELPPDSPGGKMGRLDVLAELEGGVKVNIEVQNRNEYDMERRSLYYWARLYCHGIESGEHYIDTSSVIVINLLDFNLLDGLEDFHNSFHVREDFQSGYKLTDVLEMHFIEMPKFRILKDKDLKRNPLHRWLVYVDKTSPEKLIREVTKMDTAIAMTDDKMEAIRRDPDLWYSYYRHERSMREYESGISLAARRGKQEGEYNKALAIVRQLKSLNMPFEQIIQVTELSPDEIAKL